MLPDKNKNVDKLPVADHIYQQESLESAYDFINKAIKKESYNNVILGLSEVDFSSDAYYLSSSLVVGMMNTDHAQKDSVRVIDMELVNQLGIDSANAILLAESTYELQKLFDTLTGWCKRWDMNVNSKKCGIMIINCSTDTTFKLQNQLIPSVKEYKYLEIEFNDEWNNKAFFKAKK
ncbi:hypothetical protein BB561_003212 [Smittium simulii]|uniref:Reverse transcriptase domain-containing protein n=1 Tax=Smittium simulii TaxID=133385 RepID=A0A2T9YMH4_9FUNG|nr:hypothetical protein BB561_003212 [Smittium simulii]